MEEMTLIISNADYPLVLRQYGLDGAKNVAISMTLAANQELTQTNLLGQLSILESDFEEMFG